MSGWWDWVEEPLRHGFMLRALLAVAVLGVSGGLLGCVLVMRRMALMGDALSHSLLPGIGLAYLLFGMNLWAVFAGALLAGLLTVIGSGLISRLTRLKEDAAFGSLFVVLFGLGVALVSKAGTRVDVLHILFGNILGIGGEDLWLAVGASGVTVMVFAVFYRAIAIESFDPAFFRACGGRGGWVHFGLMALVVLNLVATLQAMGIVLALGLFLLPAATAYLWCDRWGSMLLASVGIGVGGAAVGLVGSYHLGLPSGPCIVTVLGAAFIGSAVGSPRHGVIRRWTGRRHYAEPGNPVDKAG
jgi:zinc/manganese transport system permease protein